MSELGQKKTDLTKVLRYAKELLSFNRKLISDIDAQTSLHLHEADLANLEGFNTNSDDDGWIRFARINETQPPTPDPMFESWVAAQRIQTPETPPKLIDKRVLRLSIEEISDLFEAGLIPDNGDVMEPLEDQTPRGMRDVILYTANLPEFREEWRTYLEGPWVKWAETERPRRKSIAAYNELFKAHQQIQSMGADTPVELVFGLGIARWKYETHKISLPLIEQLSEIILDDDGVLQVKPRDTDPYLNLKVFHQLDLPGAKRLEGEIARSFLEVARDPDRGFSPFDRSSFENTLRACASNLSGTAQYLPDQQGAEAKASTLPSPSEILQISDTWVVYLRPRQENFREEDIQRLIDEVEAVDEQRQLPACAVKFIERPSNTLDPSRPIIDLTGNTVSGGGSWEGGPGTADNNQTYFFPLPYNDEQIEIARRLDTADGVVVQGPPGTGKTHTIANIICHYMATGRRVLVTAKTAEALAALHEKIPVELRGLAISIIHNDREGSDQLEKAVRILSSEAKQVNEREFLEQIEGLEKRAERVKVGIDAVNAELVRCAHANEQSVRYRGYDMRPMEVAQAVEDGRPAHSWLGDRLALDEKFSPQFNDDEVRELSELRKQIGADLQYRQSDIPDPSDFPDVATIVVSHRDLAALTNIGEREQAGEIPFMAIAPTSLHEARTLRSWLVEFEAFFTSVVSEEWLLACYRRLCGNKPFDAPKLAALKLAVEQWSALHVEGETLTLHSVLGLPSGEDAAFDRAASDLSAGRKPFGMFSVLKGGLKAKVEAVSLEGRKPQTADDWLVVVRTRQWDQAFSAFVARWNSLASAVECRPLPADFAAARAEFARIGRILSRLLVEVAGHAQRAKSIRSLFPYGIEPNAVLFEGGHGPLGLALAANLDKMELAAVEQMGNRLDEIANAAELPFHSGLRDFLTNLGQSDVPANAIGTAWGEIQKELTRLNALKPALLRLEELVKKIRNSGAPLWATRLRTEIPNTPDTLTPPSWIEAWEWARGLGFVESLPSTGKVRELTKSLHDFESEEKRIFSEIVRLRTFIGLKQGMTPAVHTALAKFIASVARLGRGTGRSAHRYRRVIRESVNEASAAIPCWILPEWRVAEQLPAELGLFHLAIIDEASQSDITALAAILRSKKVLIVGDDKQVSPDVVGMEDREVVQLRNTYLSGLPFADQMEPSTSLYELGSMVYPGKTIMLREHFRCVEPIIRFSSQFYQQPLVPLRVPSAAERLDPPLIDMYLPHGRRSKGHKKRNQDEARVIVDEIAKIVAEHTAHSRSIGVISLIGPDQAKLIYDMLVSEIGSELIERHHIMCGDAATFQGQERDIVLLSMIASPKNATSQASRRYQQRFNVAMSRARDRLILVRSVAASDLKPGDLKLKVIEHMRNPMGEANIAKPKDILELCDSEFEKDFAKCMIDLGYRLYAQVPVAGYKIDFVIEGRDNARLAVELDGDKFHGPDRWSKDVHRQKSLERMGWTFWRCWGSSWIADRDGCLMALKSTLDQLGIEPLGATAVPGTFTQHIEVPDPRGPADVAERPFGISANGSEPAEVPEPPTSDEQEEVVSVGDLVVIRYNDAPDRAIRIRLSDTENRPEVGIIHKAEPLGAALLGSAIDDEVEVKIGDLVRTAAIESIVKRPEL